MSKGAEQIMAVNKILPSRQARTNKCSKFRSIQSCLVALGATMEKTYRMLESTCRYNTALGGKYYSIWDSWGAEAIDAEVERLYKEAVKKFHPDLNGCDDRYVSKMVEINMARDRAKHLLRFHR